MAWKPGDERSDCTETIGLLCKGKSMINLGQYGIPPKLFERSQQSKNRLFLNLLRIFPLRFF